jgi:hypothetical protein
MDLCWLLWTSVPKIGDLCQDSQPSLLHCRHKEILEQKFENRQASSSSTRRQRDDMVSSLRKENQAANTKARTTLDVTITIYYVKLSSFPLGAYIFHGFYCPLVVMV